jgi:hypothetical protein
MAQESGALIENLKMEILKRQANIAKLSFYALEECIIEGRTDENL